MSPLTAPVADDIMELLLNAHEGLSAADSQAFNARLILVLAAELNDAARFESCLKSALLIQ